MNNRLISMMNLILTFLILVVVALMMLRTFATFRRATPTSGSGTTGYVQQSNKPIISLDQLSHEISRQ